MQARSAVLDGEIVVVDEAGRLDREELARRLAGEPGRPLSYLAFDLLHLDGRSLLNLALDRRRQLLRQVLRPGDEVVAVPAMAARGPGAVRGSLGQGLYGIRARQRASPYLPGVRSRMWRTVAVDGSAVEAGGSVATLTEHAEVIGERRIGRSPSWRSSGGCPWSSSGEA